MHTLSYGPSVDQVGDFHTPEATAPSSPTVCLLHGGFWRMPWGRDHVTPLAMALSRRGFFVWNMEYRRVGGQGGGWPGTLEDVRSGIDHLATLAAREPSLDLHRVITVGHSAGGHLALWSAGSAGQVRISAAVGLAPVSDLELAHRLNCGNGAVTDFLGGSPYERAERYAATSPVTLLPLCVPQFVIHGTRDEDVPVSMSRRYVDAARSAGDEVDYLELDTDHMELVSPAGPAHDALVRWLAHCSQNT